MEHKVVNAGESDAPLAEKLSDLFAVRTALGACSTVDDVIRRCLEMTRGRVNSQTASIFLFSKAGNLERQFIDGRDSCDSPIPQTWFADEHYAMGASFTGQAVVPAPGSSSPFGTPHWGSDPWRDKLDDVSRQAYMEKLGTLACAVAVPLNGRHRSFGVLEVINRLDANRKPDPHGIFSVDEIFWLCIIGTTVAGVISSLRKNGELALLTGVSKLMTQPFSDDVDPQAIYDDIVSALTGPLTSYKACVLLLADSPDTLEIRSRSGDRIAWEGRINAPIRKGERLVGRVYQSGNKEVVGDIESCPHEFQNIIWLRENSLKATACFPLAVKNRVFGTLSLFTGFKYDFDEDELTFISSISSLLALLTEGFEMAGKLRLGDIELAEERERVIGSARLAGYDLMVTELMHGYKNTLQNLRKALSALEPSTVGKTSKVLESQIRIIEGQINQINEQFKSSAHTKVNINHVIRGVVKYYSLELKGKHLKIETRLDDLPDIEANEVELRDIIVNLTSNAVRAIQATKRKDGGIVISSSLREMDGVDWIQIEVADNGCGIRRDDGDKIFTQGFSRYPTGTGMGLHIARKIANSYGGRIVYDSIVGKGSRFFVRLPLKDLSYGSE